MYTTTFDVIDFAEYRAEGFAYQLDRNPGNWMPVVVQLHGPLSLLAERIGWPERDSAFYQVGRFMEDMSIKRADGLMACSANIADFTANFHGMPRDAIDVVHCGVDTEMFRPSNDKAQIEDRPTVLFVGNIAVSKGVQAVFEAVMRLRLKYPGIRLQIIGRTDDGLARKLLTRAQQNGAEAAVEFPGFIDRGRIPEFYRQAHVFASPAQHESGVANVYLEAMACGCPVVASNTGGAHEAVVNGKTGLLVPYDDVRATAQALDHLVGNQPLRRQMGEAGRKRVEEYFGMDRYIMRIVDVYRKAIETSRRKLDRLKIENNAGRQSPD